MAKASSTSSRAPTAITPTAHYTGHVWVRNGLSHPELATARGRLLFEALRPAMAAGRAAGGPTLEDFLLARHRVLDAMLVRAVERTGVTQVVEVACGLSPRGWRFTRRYRDAITYVEADLPEMATLKRRALARLGSLSDRHRVEEIDALRDEGPRSLAALAQALDRGQPLAIVTEGLLGYLAYDDVVAMWRRFARVLGRFRDGIYLSDLYVGRDMTGLHIKAFRAVLSAFVRGRVHVHFADDAEAASALVAAGLAPATIHRADEHPAAQGLGSAVGLVRVVEAGATSRSRPRATPGSR